MSQPEGDGPDTDTDSPEPFSDRSRAALEATTRALITSLTTYLDTVRDISADLTDEEQVDLVSDVDEAVTDAVRAWNDAATEHTEIPPLRLVDDDVDSDWISDEDEDETEPRQRPLPRWLSIVSRYDVEVTDPDALFAAAQAARGDHGYQPEDMTGEAVRRSGVGNAVYEVRHGDTPYSDVPGVALRGGSTVYLAHDPTGPDPAPSLRADPDLRRVLPPTGNVEFLETW